MTNQISIIIHSYNSEKDIEKAIKSAKLLTDNIILIDMESNDKTVELAKKMSVQVFSFPKMDYVEPAREFGINKSTTDWVFILDSDERITPELAEEIKSVIRLVSRSSKNEVRNPQFSYYRVPRKNIFIDRWLKHGGWWPDNQIRLINKKYFKSWPKEIHSTPVIGGKEGLLTKRLLHYFHGDLKTMVDKTLIFEDIESEMLFKANKHVSTLTFFRKFFGELWRRMFKKFGFLDGTVGIIESIYQAFSKTITHLLLYEKQKKPSESEGRSL